jgi:rhodanese-related sulfurtransferase
MIEEKTPEAVAEAMETDAAAVYLDVRTVAEFEHGHVPGALNVPILEQSPETGAMVPNPGFLAVVTAAVPTTSLVFCGCATGPRSRHAVTLLQQHGYERVFNVYAGFNGVVDPLGRVREPGWAARGLPTEAGDGGPFGYAALRAAQAGPGEE